MTTSTLPAPCRACEYAVWSESLCPCDAAGCPHAARPVGLHAAAVPDPLVGGDLARWQRTLRRLETVSQDARRRVQA